MSGIVLETNELAYLLATVHAQSVIGVDNPALFPATPAEQDATYGAGLAQLKAHGWLKPLENNQFHLSDTLLLMVATLADPQLAVITVRNLPGGGAQVVSHYLAGDDIIELAQTGPEAYTLGKVTDRPALLARLTEWLALKDQATPTAQFAIPTAQFDQLRALAEGGQHEQATGLLKNIGLNGHSTDLVQALAAAQNSAQVVVVRARAGQVEMGRRAWVFRSPTGAWLAQRADAAAETWHIATVEPKSFADAVEKYLTTLA